MWGIPTVTNLFMNGYQGCGIPQEQLIFTKVRDKGYGIPCYDKLFFWHHISLGDAASTSYQHWRGLADPVWAAPFLKN